MDFDFRLGEEADSSIIADFIIAAGDGLFQSMLDGIIPGVGAVQFVRMAVKSEDSPLNAQRAILAEYDGRVMGMALGYPSSDYGLHPLLKNLVPSRRIKPLQALFDSKIDDSWYLNTLLVSDEARGRGLGSLLVQFCADLAVEEGLSSISLHAWADNQPALSMYGALGFTERDKVPVSLRLHPERTAGMLLLAAPLPLPPLVKD